MNFIPVRVVEVKQDAVKIEMPDSTHLTFWVPVEGKGVKVGDNLSLGIRPEHLLPCDQSEVCIKGSVKVVEQLGNETQVYIEMPPIKQSLVYRQNDIVLVQEGDEMAVGINPNRCHLFKEDGTACKRLFKELGV